jgi:hypothetical protein
MVSVARLLDREERERTPNETFKLLLDCEDSKRRSRLGRNDTIVRSETGEALFRISYRNNDLYIVIPRARAGSETIQALVGALKPVIENDCRSKSYKSMKTQVNGRKVQLIVGGRPGNEVQLGMAPTL